MEALAAFKEGKLQVLVATDVAARGLDIDDLPLVVNYELPHVPEDYIHRIGRTGRAGASGEAISLVAPEEERYLADIERLLKKTITTTVPEGFDASAAREERPPRAPRGRSAEGAPRAARAPRGTPGPKPVAGSAEGVARHREITIGDAPQVPVRAETRREERERAYARNPDQAPIARAAEPAAESKSALTPSTSPRRPSFGHGRPVPALLMKRSSSEPEKV